MIRNEFIQLLPEITNWVDLHQFDGKFKERNSNEFYRQAVRNDLAFDIATDFDEKKEIYDLIFRNRKKHKRPIYMTFNDVLDTSNLWPTDFFKVSSGDQAIVASGIIYRSHPEICYALFWGDSDFGRPLRAMDFLLLNLWTFYKELGYRYLDHSAISMTILKI